MQMKRITAVILMIVFSLSLFTVVGYAADEITVTVNGDKVTFDQQPIIVDGRTLVPIRAVCEKIGLQVGWDDATKRAFVWRDDQMLTLMIDSPIMKANEGSTIHEETIINLDVAPKIYNGRTLLPIRAIVEFFGCDVDWDEASRTVIITTSGQAYVQNLPDTVGIVSNWGWVSSVQQFAYRNEGLAYGYMQEDNLKIITPSRELRIEKKYPKLGDIISDDDGNFYIVWGKENDTDDVNIETVFISKYSAEGAYIKTTGFKGESRMGADGNTKNPFRSGNCVSAIGNGYLMVNYARAMYNGHQSNSVVGVKISDMSPFEWDSIWSIPYTSHSFNQDLIWSKHAGDFVYADHGDAYSRGFNITTSAGEYPIFNFYLEANANYNMFVVNKTFAQLGGLAETSKGVALVGASAKSISEAAKDEKQNLFVQIFDPTAKEVSKSMFIGGEDRSGATSMDINDNKNAPLTPVTDYGVHWLTNYTDTDVIAPQVVCANDRLVILWATDADTFYMILSADGEVLTPATSLNGVPLNAAERPVYHNGSVYWAASLHQKLGVYSIAVGN